MSDELRRMVRRQRQERAAAATTASLAADGIVVRRKDGAGGYAFVSPMQLWLIRLVRAELRERGATQRQLARALGVSEKHISRMLCGRDEGSMEMWSRVLMLLGWEFADDGRNEPSR